MKLKLALLLLALAPPAGAFDRAPIKLAPIKLAPIILAPIKLGWPAACILGDTCHIQQYPDHDAGPGATDYTCGPLSYDGHDGTDIALTTRAAMAAGVQVLAAAPGVVKGTRDGIADFVPKVEGRECGNGVVIEHSDGWETQYCHMRKGSVLVHQNDHVDTGSPLGLIGQSGQADFPHVHLSVRHNGTRIDPFAPQSATCSLIQGPTLWATPEPYKPGGFLAAGFTSAVPTFDAIRAGLSTAPLPDTAPGLVLWAYAFGTRAGDQMTFTITGPQGQILQETAALNKPQAQMFRAMGKKLTAASWPPGHYTGTAALTRDGQQIDQTTAAVTIE